MNQKEWIKEHKKLVSEEKRFLKVGQKEKKSFLNDTVERFLPDGIQEKLNLAFIKGFEVVFRKGIPIVEKTYSRRQKEEDFRVNQFAFNEKETKSMAGFRQSANRSSRKNMLISGAEGAALGVLGIGLPDIPIFIGMIIKAMQEISLSYGFSFDNDDEKIFMLKLIRTSLSSGEHLVEENISVGRLICGFEEPIGTMKEEIEKTASVLSDRLLYMKFVQGIPIVGMIGGLSDYTVMKEISQYARLAYKKRFLRKVWEEQKEKHES